MTERRRAATSSGRLQKTSVQFTPEFIAELDEVAAIFDLSRADMVRLAATRGLRLIRGMAATIKSLEDAVA